MKQVGLYLEHNAGFSLSLLKEGTGKKQSVCERTEYIGLKRYRNHVMLEIEVTACLISMRNGLGGRGW